MPLWEWILIAASLAIPVTGVTVARTFLRDSHAAEPGRSVPCPKLRVPRFATESTGWCAEPQPACAN